MSNRIIGYAHPKMLERMRAGTLGSCSILPEPSPDEGHTKPVYGATLDRGITLDGEPYSMAELKAHAELAQDITGVSFEGPAAKVGAILTSAGMARDYLERIEALEALLIEVRDELGGAMIATGPAHDHWLVQIMDKLDAAPVSMPLGGEVD